MKRKALGKGLRSLIPEAPPKSAAAPQRPSAGPREVDIDKIVPNRKQPREAFDTEKLEELATSVRDQGVLQPVIVRPDPQQDGGFELIAGERRWRAAQIAGLLKVPVIVKEIPDDRLLELALIENIQREELNAIEEARAFQLLIDDLGLTQQEVAARVGKQRTTITNALRLLNLPTQVQEQIKQGRLTAGHAKALAALTSTDLQTEIAERIVREGLSVRQAEKAVAARREAPSARPARPVAERDPNVVAAEEELQRAIGTKVRIAEGKDGGGRIEIHCYSAEELERVYEMLRSAAGATK